MLKVVLLAYIDRRSADTNLVEIHAKMSELLDKQVYVLNECFKNNFQDLHKCVMKIKQTNCRVKTF